MNLLVITHDYPPILSPRAVRWGLVVEEFVQAGHSVDVVCGWVPGQPRFAESAAGRLRVHRVGGGWFDRLRRRLGGGSPLAPADRPQNNPGRETTGLRGWIAAPRRAAASVGRAVWRAVHWPDAWCPFILPAWRRARQLAAERRPDALVTVSYPFSDHVVGLWLKQRDPGLPWLVDVGDPFARYGYVNNERLYRRLNDRAEARVLRLADYVSVTNRGALEHYTAAFGVDRDRIGVIAPVLSSTAGAGPAIGESDESTDPPHRPVRLVYCGQLYRQIRNPQPLLNLLERLVQDPPSGRSVELHLYGELSDCADLFEPVQSLRGRNLFLHGFVSRERALRAMQQADVLVNIGNATPHQVPSKIVEYIGTGKPILNLVTSPDDQTRELLERHPVALTIDVLDDSLDRQVERVQRFLCGLPRPIAESELSTLVQPFLPPAIAGAYLAGISRGRHAA